MRGMQENVGIRGSSSGTSSRLRNSNKVLVEVDVG